MLRKTVHPGAPDLGIPHSGFSGKRDERSRNPPAIPRPGGGRYPGLHSLWSGNGQRKVYRNSLGKLILKIKLDENLGNRGAELFQQAGHDVITVPQQGLCSSPDGELLEVCRKEKRCLVTLDMDFGNPLLFTPEDYAGIAILRLPAKPSPDDLIDAVRTMIRGLSQKEINGKLWTIQRGRIREYQPEN